MDVRLFEVGLVSGSQIQDFKIPVRLINLAILCHLNTKCPVKLIEDPTPSMFCEVSKERVTVKSS